jgi:ribosome-associated protein
VSQAGEARKRDEEIAARRESGAEESRELVQRVAEFASSKGGSDFAALDVRTLVGYTDYLLVCTARNERQAKAIHDEVYFRMKHDMGMLPSSVEGERESRWILMDYLDCVLHVFIPELREHYRLERLWGEAGQLSLDIE